MLHSCLKMMIQAHLHVGFFTIYFIKRASLKRFYLYMKLFQLRTILNQKTIMKCLRVKTFARTPNSKNIIETLRIVTIEICKLTFLLILCFHDSLYFAMFSASKSLFSESSYFKVIVNLPLITLSIYESFLKENSLLCCDSFIKCNSTRKL